MEAPAKKTKLDTENVPNATASQSVSSSYHGMFYHLRLGMVILLHSYNLHRKGTLPHLSITMEDCEAGKFDDIVIRYASSTTPKGTIYIQAKHKLSSENTKPLTEGDFFTKKASSTPFSIPMYFRSYLDHYRPVSSGSHAYLLCTNATIDDKMMQYFTQRHYDVSDILSFCDLINATCYSFKREGKFAALFKDLRRVSLEKLGKLLATHAKTGEEINSNDTLIRFYHNLIAMSVERVTSSVFTFKREFWTAHDATPMGRLRIIVEREYGKLPQNKPKEEAIQLTISNAFIDIPNTATNTGSVDQFCFEQIDRIIHQFCDEFLLVCGSKSESNLLSDAHELIPSWVRDRKGTFENLQTLLLEALRGEGSSTITLKQLKEKYIEVNANESFNMLRVLTQEHFQSVRNEYPFIELQEDCLKDSSLYRFICNSSSLDVHCFFSKNNVNVSSIIIAQASALRQYDCLFVNASSSQVKGNIREIVRDVMEFLFDVDLTSRYIFVIYGQPALEDIRAVQRHSSKYKIKSILVQQLTEDNLNADRFFVRDLTEEANERLLKLHKHFTIFGTTITFNRAVRDDDTLSFLCGVLERCSETDEQKNEYCNNKSFENISKWYISRSIAYYGERSSIPVLQEERIELEYPSDLQVIPFDRFSLESSTGLTHLNSAITLPSDAHLCPEELKPNNEAKVHIILDDAGYGKSTFFIALASHLSNDKPSPFVIRMIALSYSADFARLKTAADPSRMDDTAIVRILYRLIHLTLCVSNVNAQSVRDTDSIRERADEAARLFTISEGKVVLDKDQISSSKLAVEELLELRLFAEKFNEKQLLLLLDGFDEIAPHYKQLAIKFLSRLAGVDGIGKLYLSSRPYDFKAEMEQAFPSCKIHQLEPFAMRDELRFVHNYLTSELEAYKRCEERDRITVVAILYDRLMESISELKSIPLFLHMGARMLLPVVRQHVNFEQRTISHAIFNPTNNDQLRMITEFVDRKMQILQIGKTGLTDTVTYNAAQIIKNEEARQQLKRRHLLLALVVMFDKDDRATLLSNKEQLEVARCLQKLAESNEKTGIVLGVRDDVPQFSHRIFAEYFAACWLHEHKHRAECVSFRQSESYRKRELSRVREFFDRMIQIG
ncbi:uncharacterized protein LOC133393687 isoform X1 [Anopheles gambiae]|uniref:NACHT domain-containing protein n=1 Tax=Anopheles gambiae TaxID=7165 RepID=A0A453YZP9_ANOGA|nr:uncharacterized protein LOC133393687 isoform X1 [Anopheles gambiae]XP_061515641.1 uncharacterized protein LOC133393687 isoform X1 [Anopheles gambiae]